jgi:hypothetical protein
MGKKRRGDTPRPSELHARRIGPNTNLSLPTDVYEAADAYYQREKGMTLRQWIISSFERSEEPRKTSKG